MAKVYRNTDFNSGDQNSHKFHPIWRGVGFILMVLSPLLGYASMVVFLDANKEFKWIDYPAFLIAHGQDQLIYIKILIFLIFMVAIHLVLSLFAYILMKILAP